MAELMDMTAKSRKRTRPEEDDDEDGEEADKPIDVGSKLRRGQLSFSNWSVKLTNPALKYVDPQAVTKDVLKTLSLSAKREVLEVLWR